MTTMTEDRIESRVDVPRNMRVSDHMMLNNWERSSVLNDLDRDWMMYNPVASLPRDFTPVQLLQEQHKVAAGVFPQSMQYPRQYISKMKAAAGSIAGGPERLKDGTVEVPGGHQLR